jgi:hypothetical protein
MNWFKLTFRLDVTLNQFNTLTHIGFMNVKKIELYLFDVFDIVFSI